MRVLLAAIFLHVAWRYSVSQVPILCEDKVHGLYTCQDLPNACSDKYVARFLCPKFCQHCGWLEYAHLTISGTNVSAAECLDKVSAIECVKHCADSDSEIVRVMCPFTCARTADMKCEDHADVECTELPNVCNDPSSAIRLCPRFCNTCDILRQVHTIEHCLQLECTDIAPLEKCHGPGSCADDLSTLLCNRTCNLCGIVPHSSPIHQPHG